MILRCICDWRGPNFYPNFNYNLEKCRQSKISSLNDCSFDCDLCFTNIISHLDDPEWLTLFRLLVLAEDEAPQLPQLIRKKNSNSPPSLHAPRTIDPHRQIQHLDTANVWIYKHYSYFHFVWSSPPFSTSTDDQKQLFFKFHVIPILTLTHYSIE